MAIPKYTYLDFIGRKLFIWAFLLGWLQLLVRIAYIYLKVNDDLLVLIGVSPTVLPDINAYYYKNMIDLQLPLCFYFTFLMGSGLISLDLKHNAIVLYCAKPISRWEYFFGKFFAFFFLLILLTGLQTLITHVVQVAVLPASEEMSFELWWKEAQTAGAIVSYAIIVSSTLTLMILTASSLAKNKNIAATIFVVYIVGSIMIAGLLYETFDKYHVLENNKVMFAITPLYAVEQVGQQLFQVKVHSPIMPNLAAWCGLGFLWVGCIGILFRQLKRAARFAH